MQAYVPHIKIKLHVFGDRLCRTQICILICPIVGNDGLLFLLILDVIRVVHHNLINIIRSILVLIRLFH